MPKVTTAYCTVNESGNRDFQFKYDVSVNTSGVFSTTLPRDIADKFREAGILQTMNRLGNPGYVEAESMNELTRKVEGFAKDFCSSEVVEDRLVIQYTINTVGAYWINSAGQICANGSYDWAGETSSGYVPKKGVGWQEGTSEGNGYSMSVVVKLSRKTVERFRSGKEKVTYRSDKTEVTKEHPNLYFLLGLRGNNVINFKHEIPGTEDNAKFFVDLIHAMIKLNKRIKDFSTPEAIAEIVASKQSLLE